MLEEKRKRETIALTKNKSYKTYQFHGIVGKGKNPDVVFQTSIVQVFTWMQERFRNFEEIPKQLLLPKEEKLIKDSIFKSFVVENGYIIEVLYIPEESSWSFRLTEPDMGSSARLPAPGRLFITNFGFKKTDTDVEFGCQIICAQPESVEEDAEVFRPKLVRDLLDQWGLTAICELKYQSFDLSKASGKRVFQELVENPNRQMPILVIEKKSEEQKIDMDKVIENILAAKETRDPLMKCRLPMDMENSMKRPGQPITSRDGSMTEEADKLAKKLAGYATVFRNFEGLVDKVCIYYPRTGCIETDVKSAAEAIMNYPKRNEEFRFGHVLFYNEALQLKQNMDLKKLKESEDFIKENSVLHENITGLKRQIGELKQRTVELSSDHKKVKIEFDEEIFKYKTVKNRLEETLRDKERELMASQFTIDDMTERLKNYEAKAKRPDDVVQFLKWVELHFIDDLVVLPRAKDSLKKAKQLDMGMLCDAMEVLATDYKAWRQGEISEETYVCNCKSRGDSSFEIGPCGEQSIQRYAEDYRVFYNTDSKDHKDRRTLDTHLKCGVDSRYLLRVYFFWDADTGKVVIGHMPGHLQIVS